MINISFAHSFIYRILISLVFSCFAFSERQSTAECQQPTQWWIYTTATVAAGPDEAAATETGEVTETAGLDSCLSTTTASNTLLTRIVFQPPSQLSISLSEESQQPYQLSDQVLSDPQSDQVQYSTQSNQTHYDQHSDQVLSAPQSGASVADEAAEASSNLIDC